MSTLTAGPATSPTTSASRTDRPAYRRPSFARLVGVELRKTFDTRAGWWICASIVSLAVIASIAVAFFGPDSSQTYASYAQAIGIPMTVILPVLAVLTITSEWSQRSGLATFTMVPHRGRVIAAKATVCVGIGVISMLIAAAVGALGTLTGAAIAGVDPVWNVSVSDFAAIILANEMNMAIGFMLGVVLRNSPAAIVGYFVYGFVAPTLLSLLAAFQQWYADVRPWVDFQYVQGYFYQGWPDAEVWGQLAVSALPWLIVPLAVGCWLVGRSEVK